MNKKLLTWTIYVIKLIQGLAWWLAGATCIIERKNATDLFDSIVLGFPNMFLSILKLWLRVLTRFWL